MINNKILNRGTTLGAEKEEAKLGLSSDLVQPNKSDLVQPKDKPELPTNPEVTDATTVNNIIDQKEIKTDTSDTMDQIKTGDKDSSLDSIESSKNTDENSETNMRGDRERGDRERGDRERGDSERGDRDLPGVYPESENNIDPDANDLDPSLEAISSDGLVIPEPNDDDDEMIDLDEKEEEEEIIQEEMDIENKKFLLMTFRKKGKKRKN